MCLTRTPSPPRPPSIWRYAELCRYARQTSHLRCVRGSSPVARVFSGLATRNRPRGNGEGGGLHDRARTALSPSCLLLVASPASHIMSGEYHRRGTMRWGATWTGHSSRSASPGQLKMCLAAAATAADRDRAGSKRCSVDVLAPENIQASSARVGVTIGTACKTRHRAAAAEKSAASQNTHSSRRRLPPGSVRARHCCNCCCWRVRPNSSKWKPAASSMHAYTCIFRDQGRLRR